MNHHPWQPAYPIPTQANPPVQYCRNCGQYHPIPQTSAMQAQPVDQNSHNFRDPIPPFNKFMQDTDVEPEQSAFKHPAWPEAEPVQNWVRKISLIDAINIALEQMPGEAVEAQLDRKNGKLIYEIEIINDQGMKYEVEVDQSTGQVLSIKPD